jgi:hypothetical protein
MIVLTALLVGAPIGATSASTRTPAESAPCGVVNHPLPYRHVVWVLLENAGYQQIVGSSSAPYLNRLAAECGLATQYFAVSHPSLPNYVALTSGSTHGITDDAEPADHRLIGASLFSELSGNWRAYEESMPSTCDRVTSGSYAARHNPAVYYTNLGSSCLHNDVPMPAHLEFSSAFTFVTPNICDDMHSCPISSGDAWLSRTVPTILASPQYRSHQLALFITFDESDSGPDNRVATFVVAPSVAVGSRVGSHFTHYSLLRTTEALLGVPSLGAASSAPSMAGAFSMITAQPNGAR